MMDEEDRYIPDWYEYPGQGRRLGGGDPFGNFGWGFIAGVSVMLGVALIVLGFLL